MKTETQNVSKKKVWAVALFSILLTGCDCCDYSLTDYCPTAGEHIFVYDNNGLEVAYPGDTAGQKLAIMLSPTSLAFWRQAGTGVGVENGDCIGQLALIAQETDDFTCRTLIWVSGSTLLAVDEPNATSTPPQQTIATSHPPGAVAWNGKEGNVLYVTYPKDASVGIIHGLSRTEAGVISLPGTTPFKLAIPPQDTHYMLSGSPFGSIDVVSFNDQGMVKSVMVGSGVNAFDANGTYIAVVQGGDLVVYNADLTLKGKVKIAGTKVGSVTLAGANGVVVDSSSTAFLATYSDPNSKGMVVAVNMSTLSIVGQPVTVGVLPINMVLSATSGHLYVANYGDTPTGTISVLNAGSGGVSAGSTIKVGTKPNVMALRPNG